MGMEKKNRAAGKALYACSFVIYDDRPCQAQTVCMPSSHTLRLNHMRVAG